MTFASFDLNPAINEAITSLGFVEPTPIQSAAIPVLLAGEDVIGRARTGSGKTAAFGLPLLNRVDSGNHVRALVLAPTRELAMQVSGALEELAAKLPVRIATIYGGASYRTQIKALKRGASIVVGTPGRVIDLMDQKALDVSRVEYFVLDEADEMLRMGFIDDVEKVLGKLPAERQVALFSATMPRAIERVANAHLRNPKTIQVEGSALSVDHIEQQVITVRHREKDNAILRILAGVSSEGMLVFARTRARCGELASLLISKGISADALHGDLNQGARERVLARLRAKRLDVVVATDVAARGLDVDHLTHVINYDLPESAETYVHRIGRTARAGRSGTAISLITPGERRTMVRYERALKVRFKGGTLPTNKEIAKFRRTRLLDGVQALLDSDEGQEIDATRGWLGEELEARGWTAESVAAAALVLLGRDRDFDFNRKEVESRKLDREAVSPRAQAAPQTHSGINETEVVVSLGRRNGVRPADIVGAFTNQFGLPGNQIGRISVGASSTFVGVSNELAEWLLTHHKTFPLRGKEAAISRNVSSDRRHDRSDPGSEPPFRKKKPKFGNFAKAKKPNRKGKTANKGKPRPAHPKVTGDR